jgi:hypothetical protein
MQTSFNKTIANVTANTSFDSDPVDLEQVQNFSIQAKWTVPAAITFAPAAITVAAKTITKYSHGLISGSMVRMTTATTLPAGIANATTDYFVVYVDANTIKLSDTKAHALAGTNIVDLVDQGTGNHTLTVTTLNISIQPQISNDPDTVGWISYGSATVATAAGNVSWDIPTDSKWARLSVTWTAGQVTFLAVDAGQG